MGHCVQMVENYPVERTKVVEGRPDEREEVDNHPVGRMKGR